jgi:hypothetical protein
MLWRSEATLSSRCAVPVAQEPASFGEAQPVAFALEERGVQVLLKLLHLEGDGGLGVLQRLVRRA